MHDITSYVLGPVQTNAYLVADLESKKAVVIDPAWDGQNFVAEADERGFKLDRIWITHAHFDHIAGTEGINEGFETPLPIALHPEDLHLWTMQGGAPFFGLRFDPGPEPKEKLRHGQKLKIGNYQFEVRHAPGHTQGHVVFYCSEERVAFCGDVIFWGSIGRTDLPGGDYDSLIRSIHTQILTLPDETRLLTGHGPETTVGHERKSNPFIS